MPLYPLKLYFKNPYILFVNIISLLVNIFIWIWLLVEIGPQKELVFLHYNILFGIDQVGEWWRIIYLPLSGLIILCVNTVLGWLFFNKDKFFSLILNAVGLFCQFFLLIAAILLVFLNV